MSIYVVKFKTDYYYHKAFQFDGETTVESMLLTFLKIANSKITLDSKEFNFIWHGNILNKNNNLKKKIKDFFKRSINISIDISEANAICNSIPTADPFIKFENYGWYFSILHKKLSVFFDENYSNLNYDDTYKNNFINFINSIDIKEKETIIECIKKIHSGTAQEFIRVYTENTLLCYYLNKWLKKCDMEEFEKIKYFVGPFSYSLYKYAYDSKMEVNYSKKLYRNMVLKLEDFEKYKNNIGELICYPTFISTSENKYIFQSSINKNDIKSNDIYVILIIDYKCNNPSYPTPCIDISYFSVYYAEKEYIFPPFSFFRIEKVENRNGRRNDPHIIYLTVPNKRVLIEFALKNDKAIHYDKDLNELYCTE